MRKAVFVSFLLLVFVFAVPALSSYGNPAAAPEAAGVPEASPARISQGADAEITVRVSFGGDVRELPLDQYLRGVVAAEMPASFEPEALKAQAVAARTYTLRKIRYGSNLEGADVSTSPQDSSAYIDAAAAAANWGAAAETYAEKIARAVSDTDGVVMLYNGEPIDAVFHSSSDGHTESAKDVWGNDLPYLRSVSSPETSDSVPNYYGSKEVTAAEFKKAILAKYPAAKLTGKPSGWFKNEVRSEYSRVLSVEIGGVAVPGTALRSLFSLRSTAFQITPKEDSVLFTTTGYGHGVGMSQYGANALAKQGKTYREILSWYYTGVTIGKE